MIPFVYATVHSYDGDLLCLVLVPEGASCGALENCIREDLPVPNGTEFRISNCIGKAEAETIMTFDPSVRLLEYVEVDDIIGLKPMQGYRDAAGQLIEPVVS